LGFLQAGRREQEEIFLSISKSVYAPSKVDFVHAGRQVINLGFNSVVVVTARCTWVATTTATTTRFCIFEAVVNILSQGMV
jgi:hypothetical protein